MRQMLRRVTDGRFKGDYGVSSRAAWDVLRVDQAEMTLTLDGAPVYPGKPQRVVPEKENHS